MRAPDVELGAVNAASFTGGPAFPLATNVTGARPDTAAVSVFAPDTVPMNQLVMVAVPLLFVVRVAPIARPPPEATENTTCTPASGTPAASRTCTLGGF